MVIKYTPESEGASLHNPSLRRSPPSKQSAGTFLALSSYFTKSALILATSGRRHKQGIVMGETLSGARRNNLGITMKY